MEGMVKFFSRTDAGKSSLLTRRANYKFLHVDNVFCTTKKAQVLTRFLREIVLFFHAVRRGRTI